LAGRISVASEPAAWTVRAGVTARNVRRSTGQEPSRLPECVPPEKPNPLFGASHYTAALWEISSRRPRPPTRRPIVNTTGEAPSRASSDPLPLQRTVNRTTLL
jgi:hypothetical protein